MRNTNPYLCSAFKVKNIFSGEAEAATFDEK